jgi:phosphatidylserine decarboxylase
VQNLFCVNERLVTVLQTPLGRCAVVAVGATIVGRIRAYYDATIQPTNLRGAQARNHTYESPIPLAKGAELGAFEIGSTVILLFEKNRVVLDASLRSGAPVRVGQVIGGPAQ